MSKIQSKFVTSDWHVGHSNVISFDKRPFRDLDHMHTVLINNYNSTVNPDSVCFFLGDMGICSGDLLSNIIAQLHGTKVLIIGNHDKSVNAMYRAGFDVVLNSAALVIAGRTVTMSHCPLRGVWREDVSNMNGSSPGENWHKESVHVNFSINDNGQFHLHGHTHKGPEERLLGKQWDVGVRANGYRPVSFGAIESWIAVYKKTEQVITIK